MKWTKIKFDNIFDRISNMTIENIDVNAYDYKGTQLFIIGSNIFDWNQQSINRFLSFSHALCTKNSQELFEHNGGDINVKVKVKTLYHLLQDEGFNVLRKNKVLKGFEHFPVYRTTNMVYFKRSNHLSEDQKTFFGDTKSFVSNRDDLKRLLLEDIKTMAYAQLLLIKDTYDDQIPIVRMKTEIRKDKTVIFESITNQYKNDLRYMVHINSKGLTSLQEKSYAAVTSANILIKKINHIQTIFRELTKVWFKLSYKGTMAEAFFAVAVTEILEMSRSESRR